MGALFSLTFSSPVVIRLGARLTLAITILGTAILLSLAPFMPNAPSVFCLLFLVGLLGGAFEINLNVEIGKIEAQVGFGIMNRAHGFWSVGFFVTAISASIIRQAEISMQAHLHLVLVLVFVLGVINVVGMKNAPDKDGTVTEEAPHFALPTPGLLPLCLIGIAAFLVEGAGIDWSAIYMRDIFNAEPFIGGHELSPETPWWHAFVRFTLPGYVVALGICVFTLWIFERLGDSSAVEIMLSVIVLGFPASLGAAAARLIL